MTHSLINLSQRTEVPLLIAFLDLTGYAAAGREAGDRRMADVMDAFYERVAQAIEAAGGHVVKFIGDDALVVFPEERAEAGVNALLDLRLDVEDWLRQEGWGSHLVVKAHFGTAVAGPYGARGAKRLDVIGNAVNVAATLPSRGFAISAEAFRRLGAQTRRRFKKHTPPITYIPVEDRRPQ